VPNAPGWPGHQRSQSVPQVRRPGRRIRVGPREASARSAAR
jgi:hypothetical protein